MHRPWQIWLTFAACLTVVIAAVGWLSFKALESDAAEATAHRQAAQEENVRLALWRMDSQIAPLVAQENARPYFVYNAFYSAERAFGRMFNRGKGDADITVPTPFLTQPDALVLLHFQFDAADQLNSPEVPTGRFFEMAVPQYLGEPQFQENQQRLAELKHKMDAAVLLADLPAGTSEISTPAQLSPNDAYQLADADPSNQVQQAAHGQMEYQARQKSFAQSNTAVQSLNNAYAQEPDATSKISSDVRMSMMTPLWLQSDLALARRVNVAGRDYLQGCLLDWPAIKRQLLTTVADLLPHADLMPAIQADSAESVRRMASLPVQLIPGPLPELISNGLSPVKASLLVAWAP